MIVVINLPNSLNCKLDPILNIFFRRRGSSGNATSENLVNESASNLLDESGNAFMSSGA